MMADTTTALDEALRYAALGLRVVPITPGDKAPSLTNWPDAATTDEGLITEWFGRWPSHGVGIVTGRASGVFVLDIDAAHGKVGYESLADLEAEHGSLPDTATVHTGSGGEHRYFRYPPGDISLRNSAGRLGPGLDIRGEGGQCVAPPTLHPETGQPYAHDVEYALGDVAIAEAPTWLIDLLRPPDDGAADVVRPSNLHSPVAWDNYSLNATNLEVAKFLEAAGWTPHIKTRDGVLHLTRPGKARGTSGTVGGVNPGVFYCFTDGAPPFEAERAYSAAWVFAHVVHGGDAVAADRALADIGWGHRSIFTAEEQAELVGSYTADAQRAVEEVAVATSSWRVRDISPALSGEIETPRPTIMRMAGSEQGLFYPGLINGIHAKDGVGKSWVALTACVEQIRLGRSVAWVDFEEPHEATVITRLRTLGLDDDTIARQFHYVNPDDPSDSPGALEALTTDLDRLSVSFVAVDSVGEAFGLDGINENADDEVTPWMRRVARAINGDGRRTVILIDHATNANDDPLRPAGSKRKRATIQGAAYEIVAARPMAKDGYGGRLRFRCAKDRHGAYVRGAWVADIEYSGSLPMTWTVEPTQDTQAKDALMRSELIETIVDVLADQGATGRKVMRDILRNDRRLSFTDRVLVAAIEEALLTGQIVERDDLQYKPLDLPAPLA